MTDSEARCLAAETRTAYEQWAPHYPPEAHNPLMRAEERSMRSLWPDVKGRAVLDLACGTGRYARLAFDAGASQVIATDFCSSMLARVHDVPRVCASMMQLPFGDGGFDVVVCGLAVGHACNVFDWMAEVARVTKTGGTLLYSDFHPEASRAGLPRSFKGREGELLSVPHQRHELSEQREAAAAAGLIIDTVVELRVGVEVDAPRPQACAAVRQWQGLPVVLVVRARK